MWRNSSIVSAAVLGTTFVGSAAPQARMTPVTPPNGVKVRFQDGDSVLRKSMPQIRAIIDSTVRLVSGVLPVSGVTILVSPDARRAIPGYGVGGYTPRANQVEISIDAVYADSAALFPQHLRQTVAHELHHAARDWGPGYGQSLFEALVAEGLADHFAVALLRIAPPPWTHALTEKQVRKFLDIARSEFDRPSYDHARWFFGTGDLPRWTGYSLGYALVSKYLTTHPGQTAASLVGTPAQAFRP